MFRPHTPFNRPPTTFSIFEAITASRPLMFEELAISQLLELPVWSYGCSITGYQPVLGSDVLCTDPTHMYRGEIILGVRFHRKQVSQTETPADSNTSENVMLNDSNVTPRSTSRSNKKRKTKKSTLVGIDAEPLKIIHPIRPSGECMDIPLNADGGIDMNLYPLSQTSHAGTYAIDAACFSIASQGFMIVGLGDPEWDYSDDNHMWMQNKNAIGIVDYDTICTAINELLKKKTQSFIRIQTLPLGCFTLKQLMMFSDISIADLQEGDRLVICMHRPGSTVQRAPVCAVDAEQIEELENMEKGVFGCLSTQGNEEILSFMTEKLDSNSNRQNTKVKVKISNPGDRTPPKISLTESDVAKNIQRQRGQLKTSKFYQNYCKKLGVISSKTRTAQRIIAGIIRPQRRILSAQQETSNRSAVTPMNPTEKFPSWLKQAKTVASCRDLLEVATKALYKERSALQELTKQRVYMVHHQLRDVEDLLFKVHWHATPKEASGDQSVALGGISEQDDIHSQLNDIDKKIDMQKLECDSIEAKLAMISMYMTTLMADNGRPNSRGPGITNGTVV